MSYNDLHSTTYKPKDRATRTPLKRGEMNSGKVNTIHIRRVTVKQHQHQYICSGIQGPDFISGIGNTSTCIVFPIN